MFFAHVEFLGLEGALAVEDLASRIGFDLQSKILFRIEIWTRI